MSATRKQLGELHELVAQQLLRKVTSREPAVPGIEAAITFLKDNRIVPEVTEGSAIAELAQAVKKSWEEMR